MSRTPAGPTPRPPIAGSLLMLLLSLPAGITSFVVLVTLTSVGAATAVVWVGVPVGALAILLARGGARLERRRVHRLLDVYVPPPYRPLPSSGVRRRWAVRLTDSATWRDYLYLMLLLPVGIVEFVFTVVPLSVAAALVALPVYYRFLPTGAWHFPGYDTDLRWITVDSVASSLPWAALGVLLLAACVVVLRATAAAHARLARAVLGPSSARMRELDTDSGHQGRGLAHTPVVR
ncbi:sensor domain-containing protein [Saccharomonospora saliphila]|uniref:sensor domain-containing protein n=1 Tax=Saccharomonospora saliphila TaxID=369829 RepID=UPI0003699A04|nr:sensor domain-containing protein [Saccharomonospora saliphila]